MVALLVSTTSAYAFGSIESGNCAETLADLVVKLENNYIGLRQLQLAGKSEGYEARKATFAGRADRADANACTRVLQEFLSVFDDGHVFAFERPEYVAEELDAFGEEVRKGALGIDELDQLLKTNRNPGGIVGRWGDGKSEIAIVGAGEEYRAYLLTSPNEASEPGELKAVLTTTEDGFEGIYYSHGHAPRYVTAGLYKEGTLLSFGSAVLWAKLESSYAREVRTIDAANPSRPTIERLDDESILLSIPSFLVEFDEFQNFLSKHEKTLARTRNLVVDIRGNTGGNAIYFPLLKLFADRSKPGSQGLVLASKDNLAYFQSRAKGSRIYRQVVTDIENNMGAIVDGPAYPEKKLKRAKTDIVNVAILTDEGCMSAAESFVLHAKAVSDNVTTFGGPTAGVIDYTSVNLLRLASGTRNIIFGYPTSTLHKNIPEKGYNKTGIVPDVPIDRDVRDKVAFVLESIRPTNLP